MPPAPLRRVRRVRGVVGAVTATLLVVGCTGSGDGSGPSAPTATVGTDEGTPLTDVDTTSLVVRRAPFCDLVDRAAVARALGVEDDEVPDVAAYGNGQRTQLTAEVKDVAHEYGCTWAVGESEARAWVFAPPVTQERALTLFKSARDVAGCTTLPGADFGDPSLARSCRSGSAIETSYRGLFGDAWLTCTLQLPGGEQADLADRAGRWCSAVALAAAS
jgi:hypothetical protein